MARPRLVVSAVTVGSPSPREAARFWGRLLGYRVTADDQPQDDVRVLLSPDGHPFCLFL